ncbi:MAG: Dam family site-specific DNA-(adenine-N6)-methyltransferase [Armatimonadetes bacterium]|nr:Dam family site-specific DNA-(adenine-N6)-methyltransferase [Armatimonadota bacterium]
MLAQHKAAHGHDYYYELRAQDPQSLNPTERAARTLYLNKTCYNGLYRVNSKGLFNVPLGRYKKPGIRQGENLRALQGVELAADPFESVLELAGPGDLVYFDPPYQPLSATSNFTSYTSHNFGEREQRKPASVLAELDQRGAGVLLSKAHTAGTAGTARLPAREPGRPRPGPAAPPPASARPVAARRELREQKSRAGGELGTAELIL